ncbi:LAQU0S27e00298g1_1 [Lachancea quebecensis]|uniref:LAQU0S27e00298g1_1 n=1 Tax=Lachancea quebecensis TaxID=1654605 RepID=A0A0P1KY80_9SACH|nr:LAQU0S27e00298g1_1 [Lachancea quebecensis]
MDECAQSMGTRVSEKGTPAAEKAAAPSDVELKNTIEKTASFVARNGTEFEKKLDRVDFPFVDEQNAYYPYYKQFLGSISTNDQGGTSKIRPETSTTPPVPYPFVFSTFDRHIPRRDLDIIKVTALFCVVNEETRYLETLRKQCSENELLAFLDPNHALYATFTHFINQYKQVARKDFGKLIELGEDPKLTFLQRSFQRAEFDEYSQSREAEQRRSREHFKLKFSAYDWEKFELLGSIDFRDSDEENLSEPLNFDVIRQRSLQKNLGTGAFEGSLALSSLPRHEISETDHVDTTAKAKKKNKMKIRAAGETRLKKNKLQTQNAESEKQLIECPITHRMIPEANFDRHIQVLLSDPNYSRERQEYEAKNNITNLTLESVHQNIKRLSKATPAKAAKRQKL